MVNFLAGTLVSGKDLFADNRESDNFGLNNNQNTVIHITNNIGQDATVVWTIEGTKNKVFTIYVPNGDTETEMISPGSYDGYIKAGSWYKAGPYNLEPYYEYDLEYYFGSDAMSSLIPIPESEAPEI